MPKPVLYIAGKDPLWEVGGGHSSYVRAHCRAAMCAGFEPHLFCTSEADGVVQTEYGFVHRFPSPSVRWLGLRNRGALIDIPIIAAAVDRYARAHPGPHLIHSFAFWGSAGVTAAERLAASGIATTPIVSLYTTVAHESAGVLRGLSPSHGHVFSLKRRIDHLWITLVLGYHEKKACRQSRLVIVNYAAVRQLLHSQYGIGSDVRSLPYAPESAFLRDDGGPVWRQAQRRPAAVPLIVAVSRHDPRKGNDVLIRALARLRSAGLPYRARLIGPGPLLSAHRRLAHELGLDGSVSIEGFVPDVFAVLRQADIFVLPSLEEGGGSLSLLEAFQFGIATVASDCDGIAEDVADGENGLLVRPADIDALCRALEKLIVERDLRERLGCHARETFVRRFSAESLSGALRETYAGLGFTL